MLMARKRRHPSIVVVRMRTMTLEDVITEPKLVKQTTKDFSKGVLE